jgi:hypothetical protein
LISNNEFKHTWELDAAAEAIFDRYANNQPFDWCHKTIRLTASERCSHSQFPESVRYMFVEPGLAARMV